MLAQSIAKQQAAAPSELPVCILGMMFCGMEYPCGQWRATVLAVLLLGFLCTFLVDHGRLGSP